jgi:hypothetical protein
MTSSDVDAVISALAAVGYVIAQRTRPSSSRKAAQLQPITSTPSMEQADPRPSRRFERRPVKANAFIHFRGRFQPAKVIDYSDGGVQLDGTFVLITADRLQIEFIAGARVPGRVAWSLGAQTGVVVSPP